MSQTAPVGLLLMEDEPHILREMARAISRRLGPLRQTSPAAGRRQRSGSPTAGSRCW